MRPRILILVVLVLCVVAVAIFILSSNWALESTLPATNNSPTSTTSAISLPNPDCGGCVGFYDNGRTIAIVPTSRITLELPSSLYDEKTLVITPKDSMGETFGASSEPGNWVRTFEAVSVGTTTISVPSKDSGAPLFKLTLRIVGPDSAWENGFKIITADDQNSTVYLRKNERFLIQFGSGLSWNLSFAPTGIITRIPNSKTADGFQGVYEASGVSSTTLHAIGRPTCAPGELCAQFLVEITIKFLVMER